MTDWRKYEAMRDAGASPQEVYLYLYAEKIGSIQCIKILRTLFDLSLVEAKEVTVTADGTFKSLGEYQLAQIPMIEKAIEIMILEEEHEPYIRECIRLAEEAKKNGNHPFGSILVHDGKILLRAQNAVNTYNDISQHPESILAIAGASKYDADFLAECTLYTSTEPCAMCSGAIYWSGIGRVIYACSGETLYQYASNGLHISCEEIFAKGDRKVEVIGHILEEEAAKVHVGFWT